MEQMTASYLRDMLVYAADRIIASKERLTELDRQIGDGDHGIGMERGMLCAKMVLNDMPEPDDIYLYFSTMGRAMLINMGGASGVIFGTMFSSAAKNQPASQTLTPEAFAQAMSAGLNGVKVRGKAGVGDKTMVDAFEPACTAMRESSGDGFAIMLRQAAEAAEKGARKTADYQAKFGRAKSLLERAVGHMDSGAVSTAILFRAMADYAAEHSLG